MESLLYLSSMIFGMVAFAWLLYRSLLMRKRLSSFFFACGVCLLGFELYREILFVAGRITPEITPARIMLFRWENIIVGILIREVILYAEEHRRNRL
jgi:hypothetical protein